MKSTYTFIWVFFTCLCSAQTSGIAYYSQRLKSMDTDKRINSSELDPNLKATMSEANKAINELEYILKFSDEFAIYENRKKMINDNSSELSIRISKIMAGYLGPSYYDLDKGDILLERKSPQKLIFVKKKNDSYNWNLTKEHLKINNLNCYKATTSIVEERRSGIKSVEIIAWYTTDISVPVGPNGFAGLPGLIVQIEKGNFITSLNRIEFLDMIDNIVIPTPDIVLNEEAYQQFLKNQISNRRKRIVIINSIES